MTEEERILAGKLFTPADPELGAMKRRAHGLSQDFNALYEDDPERDRILHELLGAVGEGTRMLGPIRFHYGSHTRIGAGCFLNVNLTVQDDALVTIGDHCSFGPNVTIVTPLHPLVAEERRSMVCEDGIERSLCWAKPVTIGDDCWLGANVVVCPGVSIGDRCVIGAGSVVTKDVPADSLVVGVPARVVRTITEADSIRGLFDEMR